MSGKPLAQIYGVRHLSPAGAVHLKTFLDQVDPEVVLIEGPSDGTEQLQHLAHAKTRPPVALLAFTKARPVRSLIYPLAAYSPEWVALRWALTKKRKVRFMDLPAETFLALRDDDAKEGGDRSKAYLDDPYEAIAKLSGEPDHETWWERHFEHTVEVAAYRNAIHEFGRGLRELAFKTPEREKETLLREAFMRRELRAHVKKAEKAVAVCGAFHAPVLTDDEPALSDEELAKLPRAECVLTLMPYSYPRLSAQSGYGAGNHAPHYYELLHEEVSAGKPERLRARYFSALAAELRSGGLIRSSAEVIECVRLAEGLASLNGSSSPALRDLVDAAVTLLGNGERLPIEKARNAVEIGTAIGTLPPGVTRTALQDDFHQLIKTLKLEKYLKDEEQKLELDLRENRFAKSKDTAFLDRARSTFLHRLDVLDVSFGSRQHREQKGTAREAWKLRWTPECEIRLAERSLEADSLESGAAWALAQRLATATDVGQATGVVLRAAECELADALSAALKRVQDLTVDEGGFAAAAGGIENLLETIRYGDVRDVDPKPLRPVLAQLYLRSTLLAFGACVSDDDACKAIAAGMDKVQNAAFIGEEGLDAARWIDALQRIAASDDRNPYLSGYAAALLIERGKFDDAAIDREVSRRLSPGTEASVGVGWFEGLVQRNRAALFLRPILWKTLSEFVDGLDDEAFKKALLYLRRAFSSFSAGEVRRVAGLLGELWKTGGAELAREVERKLDQDEIKRASEDLEGLDLSL